MSSVSIYCFYFSILLQICGLFFFFIGFLPTSSTDKYKGDAAEKTCKVEVNMETSQQVNDGSKQKKLVLMVVDALREDFVFKGNRMPFLQKLIHDKKTISFLAKGHPPTVTLPRIKAMVTGAVPGFIDVVMNLASTELKEDNILLKMNQMGKKINFFGDDTWLKLFPNCFMRHDGTTSFVVSDYKEVDDNITRHLSDELSKHDWDVLIMHFLGLDHIGHSAGPTSPLVGPKLQEMDQIIQEIMEALMKRNRDSNEESLFALTSDHGMNDAGSHGGASLSEVLTPLVFMSPRMMDGKGEEFTRRVVSQVDLTPSIASFFDFEIPENSVGAEIVDLLKFLPVEKRKDKLRRNICQLSKQSKSTELDSLADYCNVNKTSLNTETLDFLTGLLKDLSLHLQKQSSEYKTDKMNLGLFLISVSLICALWTMRTFNYSALDVWFCMTIILHSLCVTSSSYIEEEHQFWYFVVTTSLLMMLLLEVCSALENLSQKLRTSTVNISPLHQNTAHYFAALVAFRFARAWNQTGIKWLDQPDISSFLLRSDTRTLLIVSLTVSLALIFYLYFWRTCTFYKLLAAIALVFVFINKLIALQGSPTWLFSLNGIVEARIVFTVCLVILLCTTASNCLEVWKNCMNIPLHVDESIAGSKKKYVDDSHAVSKTKEGYVDDFITASVAEDISKSSGSDKSISGESLAKKGLGSYKEGYFYAFLVLYLLLQRPHNVLWLCLIIIIERKMDFIRCQRFQNHTVDVSLVILYYCLGKASFHAQGHSNSLACVDISAAFIGVNHYSPLLSGFLTSIATYGSHVFWFSNLKQFSSESCEQRNQNKWTIRYIYNAILTLESLVICLVTYMNRYHLFIWTVFAPKFLFLASFRLFMLILILIS